MKPAQKFLLGCRQTGEAASRLGDWLALNPALLGLGHAAVQEDLDGLAARLTPLARAAEQTPGVGLVSTEIAAKIDLLFSMLATRAPMTLGEFGQRPLEGSTIRSLLPQDGEAGGCAILRFSAAEMPPAPRGYPIRIAILSMTDVAAIVARAAHAARYQSAGLPTAAEIATLFCKMSSRLSPQSIPGLSEDDVLDLRETLNALLHDDAMLAALGAARYWPQFREIAPHICDRDRRLVLAVLWRNDPAFTALFDRLCDGLERLGQGAEAYCSPEALLGKDRSSGWMTRHPLSIIHAATLLTLAEHAGPHLNVMNRYGQAVDIEHAVMAGLVAELPLHIGASRLAEISPAEILDFPVAPHHAATATRPNGDGDLGNASAHFVRAKALYLFDRACLRRDVTSLIVVVNPDCEDDSYAAAIGDWVETAQGSTAHARVRVRRGLFVAAVLPADARGAMSRDGVGNASERVRHHVRAVIGDGQDWPQAWTPGRPMNDVFWFDSGDGGATAAAWQPVSGTAMAVAPAASLTSNLAAGAVAELIAKLALSSDTRMRQVQLNQALQDVRRRLHMCALRHHASNDPAALFDWRRGMAVVVQDRLRLISENGRLGHLQRALLPREADLVVAIEAGTLASRTGPTVSPSPGPWHRDATATRSAAGSQISGNQKSGSQKSGGFSEQVSKMAEYAVEHWFAEMRRAARSGRLCRELRIEPAILHNLVDELQIGAIRVALASEIAAAVMRAPGFIVNETTAATPVAAYAFRIVSAYLELLAAPAGRGRQLTTRGRRTGHDAEVADAVATGYGSSGSRPLGMSRTTRHVPVNHWEESFAGLVEDNIASALLLVSRGDKDRELGELIGLFASGPFEVEP